MKFEPPQPGDDGAPSEPTPAPILAEAMARVDAAITAEAIRPRIMPVANNGRRVRSEQIDEHDVLSAFGVQCSAVGDAIRKLLTLGRTGRPRIDELQEVQATVSRAIELERDRLP